MSGPRLARDEAGEKAEPAKCWPFAHGRCPRHGHATLSGKPDQPPRGDHAAAGQDRRDFGSSEPAWDRPRHGEAVRRATEPGWRSSTSTPQRRVEAAAELGSGQSVSDATWQTGLACGKAAGTGHRGVRPGRHPRQQCGRDPAGEDHGDRRGELGPHPRHQPARRALPQPGLHPPDAGAEGGSIACMSSVSAQRGGGIFGGPHYSAAKAGVLGLAKAMARELGPDGIRVNCVTPGLIQTDITGGKLSDEMKAEIVKGIPLAGSARPRTWPALSVPRLRPLGLRHRRGHRRERRHAHPLSGTQKEHARMSDTRAARARMRQPGRTRLSHPPQRAAHGRGAGPGLYRPGARHRRRAGRRLLPRDALPAGGSEWEGRDRFLLSNGHYAIALYAALIEAGIIPEDELETYGADDSRLPMSGMAAYTPGMEISAARSATAWRSAVGMALGPASARARPRSSTTCCPTASWTRARPGRRRCRPRITARQPRRHRRRQQPAGRRPVDADAGLRAAGRQVARLRLVRAARRRQRHRRPSSPPSTRRGRIAEPQPADRHLRHADGQGRAVPRERARRTTSSASTPHEWDRRSRSLDAGRPA